MSFADASKLVETLGAFPLPVEVVPFAKSAVAREVARLGCEPVLRATPKGDPFVTDNGNWVLDCRFGRIADPARVAATLDAIPGIADHGLFLGMAERLVLGLQDGGTRVTEASPV